MEIMTAWLLSDEELLELSQRAENILRLKKKIQNVSTEKPSPDNDYKPCHATPKHGLECLP